MREACKRGRARQHEGRVRMLIVDSDGSGRRRTFFIPVELDGFYVVRTV